MTCCTRATPGVSLSHKHKGTKKTTQRARDYRGFTASKVNKGHPTPKIRKRHRARHKGLNPIGSQHTCSTRDRKLAARP